MSVPPRNHSQDQHDLVSAAEIASKPLDAPALQGPLSQWPRRLLHVPTMTSLVRKWENGIPFYGSKSRPEYNILTYTWGRWQLDFGPALDIKGVSWKIPPVDQVHFSVEDLQRIIHRVSKTADYVWIDVACIDQENDEVKLDEIGHQAGIFEGAERVFVWLSHSTSNELQLCVDKANQSYRMCRDYSTSTTDAMDMDRWEWTQMTADATKLLFSDPWFSSLWTLQEAYLRQDAILLSKDASTIIYPESQFVRPTILYDLIGCYYQIYRAAERLDRETRGILNKTHRQSLKDLISQIKRSGLPPLHDDNPISIYGVACFRQAQTPAYRIYGIMQIFGLRLGHSSEASAVSSSDSLEAQLGEQLNLRSPIHSQLFVHLAPVSPLSCWRVSQYARVPEMARWAMGRYGRKIRGRMPAENFCRILATPERRVKYVGFSCSFPLVLEFWREIYLQYAGQKKDQDGSAPPNSGMSPARCVRGIYLDNSPFITSRPIQTLGPSDEDESARQEHLANSLVESFGNELRLALVGKLNSQAQGLEAGTVDIWAAILLLPQRENSRHYWARIGFCLWEMRQYEMMERAIWRVTEYFLA